MSVSPFARRFRGASLGAADAASESESFGGADAVATGEAASESESFGGVDAVATGGTSCSGGLPKMPLSLSKNPITAASYFGLRGVMIHRGRGAAGRHFTLNF
jgi:hypothetical protein